MDSGVRKKRTLAERRESDKLRQRRFRAKKREEQRLLQVIHGVVEHEKKERVYTLPKKTADEIRETNRIRQQRFRAKRRGEDISEGPPLSLLEIPKIPMEEKKPVPIVIKQETPPPPPPIVIPVIQETPEEIMKRLILQAANDEKNRQTEIRREKDRVRKRRERQRKRDRAMKLAGLTSDEMIKLHFQKTLKNMEINEAQKAGEQKEAIQSEDDMEDDEVQYSDIMNIEQVVQPVEEEENPTIHLDANNFIAQLAEMGFQFDATTTPTPPENIDVAIKQESLSDESTSSTSSSTPETPRTPLPFEMFTEKKPWQRCNTSEERRERERMRKRVYRAKRKYISTGKLEMQWDPSPIKRSPNDDVEEGITPLPEWNANLSSEQKAEAHRIYNKRYRERLKSSALKGEESRSQSRETLLVEHDQAALSSEMITELLSTISQGHLPSLVSNKVAE
ncbi:hypothetical protein CRE_22098 [Caenorhabditis remanei]|uniref:Uncharacterized protein n=1 Tax=Caenorhabditis remanei TaxID=31234 RepID=E3NCL7_CAERE|nr:hypothetical protein CRE_22098 [Caenorhabditis remanei]